MSAPLHTLGMHANHIARGTSNERMQAILQWVGVGSVIMMGAAATVHLFRDITRPSPEPYPRHKHREMLDDLESHYSRNERGR